MFLCCSNATGSHKLKIFVIGKAKKPRCFKNFQCPTDYKSSKSAWTTSFKSAWITTLLSNPNEAELTTEDWRIFANVHATKRYSPHSTVGSECNKNDEAALQKKPFSFNGSDAI
ncbi:PREDICTED: jerky protein homolog-like [Rhagoletis zephyria]|uniref:jerky protein homolog-like n=1 Tax=Rhagoletis zephyria TaxID=28612 RepID=UPI000811A1C6|nr:PREDICTED: jerky protein homolog-like [Rhagoletis zephyria]